MNNAQLQANGMAPLPASFNTMLEIYTSSWQTYRKAEKALEREAQHPDNFNGRGALTERGKRIIYKLFSNGFKDTDIADLMDMDHSSVSRRRKQWEAKD